jgi:hypothetical protein
MEMKTSPTTTSALKQLKKLQGFKLAEVMSAAILRADHDLQQKGLHKIPLAESERQNPVIVILYNEIYIPSASGAYKDLAEIFLAQARNTKARQTATDPVMLDGSPIPRDDEYVSLAAFIRMNTDWPPVRYMPESLFLEPDIEQITSLYFLYSQSALDQALERVCTCVYNGVPLFRRGQDGLFSVVPFDDGDYVYLSKKEEHGETLAGARHAPGCIPPWADKYFLQWGHLRTREAFFGHWKSYHTREAVDTLRTAFRRQIGFADVTTRHSAPTTDTERPLLRIVSETLAQYHRDGSFGPGHHKGSIEKAVKNWLRETYDIKSNRQLDAIYVVTREAQVMASDDDG